MKRLSITFFILYLLSQPLIAQSGKRVFETYCWGCHHQTAMAFGPSFTQIASKRSADEIRAMITNPQAVSKLFGYTRNAMPAFPKMNPSELQAITDYILSFRPKPTITLHESYSTVALTKEN